MHSRSSLPNHRNPKLFIEGLLERYIFKLQLVIQSQTKTLFPNCRNPKLFIEGLLERYVSEVQRLTPGASQAPGSSLVGSPSKPGPGSALVPAKPAAGTAASAGAPTVAAAAAARSAAEGATAADGTAAGADVDLPLLLSAAAVAALQAQPGLAEHAVSLGYVEKLLRLLAARAPQLPPGGLSVELLDADPLLPGGQWSGRGAEACRLCGRWVCGLRACRPSGSESVLLSGRLASCDCKACCLAKAGALQC